MLPHPSTYSLHQVHLLAASAAQECHLERLTKRSEDRSQETALGFLQLCSVDHGQTFLKPLIKKLKLSQK